MDERKRNVNRMNVICAVLQRYVNLKRDLTPLEKAREAELNREFNVLAKRNNKLNGYTS